ncbi:GldM family protein [Xylanibacter muris]|uniref:Gliding motility protein GldM n=1 Tax=Xylanibacter muris TaxID=2736290 RepID=A0ABX2AP38_9BACT|nr:GldM family protein [Xylanibacter muris]NPD92900.1 hypothetical protein [Xylanibacter muris]
MANYNLSSRQKMINLIYIILMAMLAINVSNDVMDGYSVLNKDCVVQSSHWMTANKALLDRLKKAGADSLYDKGLKIDSMTLRLIGFTNGLKERIAKQADKEKYVKGKLIKEEDLKSVPYIMLAPTQGNGRKLREDIDRMRTFVGENMKEIVARNIVMTYLNTEPEKNSMGTSFSWERESFSSLPAIGGILLINRIQESVLLSENMALRDLTLQAMSSDGDLKALNEANRIAAEQTGQDVSDIDEGGMENTGTVTDLYTGMSNKLDLFPGIPAKKLIMTTDNGKVRLKNNSWVIVPDNSSKANITVRRTNGKLLGKFSFNVRRIPDPTPYIQMGDIKYMGGVPVGRNRLGEIGHVGAQYSDGDMTVNFVVVGFETVFTGNDGKIVSLHSGSGRFTEQQLERIRGLKSGDKMYVTSITVKDSGGNHRETESITVIVN